MDIEHTSRGFALVRFADLAGCKCSMQDSSIGNEAGLRFGVSRDEHGEHGERMHLTQRMAAKVARLMRIYADAEIGIDGDANGPYTTFVDRDGSECMLNVTGDGVMLLGVTSTQDKGNFISLMMINQDLAKSLLPPLLAFVHGGSVESDATGDPDAVQTRPEMDVKIPPSMLARTEVAASGVSVAELVETLLDLLDVEDVDSLRSTHGHDRGDDLYALHAKLKPLRAE